MFHCAAVDWINYWEIIVLLRWWLFSMCSTRMMKRRVARCSPRCSRFENDDSTVNVNTNPWESERFDYIIHTDAVACPNRGFWHDCWNYRSFGNSSSTTGKRTVFHPKQRDRTSDTRCPRRGICSGCLTPWCWNFLRDRWKCMRLFMGRIVSAIGTPAGLAVFPPLISESSQKEKRRAIKLDRHSHHQAWERIDLGEGFSLITHARALFFSRLIPSSSSLSNVKLREKDQRNQLSFSRSVDLLYECEHEFEDHPSLWIAFRSRY